MPVTPGVERQYLAKNRGHSSSFYYCKSRSHRKCSSAEIFVDSKFVLARDAKGNLQPTIYVSQSRSIAFSVII